MHEIKVYKCVNCGEHTGALYRTYGPAVLKLNKCVSNFPIYFHENNTLRYVLSTEKYLSMLLDLLFLFNTEFIIYKCYIIKKTKLFR